MRILEYVLLNFATPIVFFIVFHTAGSKPAIAFAVGTNLVQVAIHRLRGIRFSPFFLVSSVFTVLFGVTDLILNQPQVFRLLPAAQNYLLGLLFLISWMTRHPLAIWFAGALPEFLRPKLTPELSDYLRKVTLAWAIYFILKATLFLYLAFRVNLGELILLRSVIGGISLAGMLLGEILYRKWIKKL